MANRPIRLAVRALIVQDAKLLLVNAFAASRDSNLWCAPGGGVEPGTSLPENLTREVHEETGLSVSVGELALVNEFHDPNSNFHQVDLFFRCQITAGNITENWKDPELVVERRKFFSMQELAEIRYKPDCLADVAFGAIGPARYDPLEPLVL